MSKRAKIPKLSRQTFEFLAEWAKEQGLAEHDTSHLVWSLAYKLMDTNPHFDMTRFINACGIETVRK